MSVVSLYYYLRVLKRVYVAPLPAGANKFNSPVLSQVLLLLLAASVILFGCAPQLLLRWIEAAIRVSGL
jgi:NADH-quinone oxidoreductase subunit N